MRRILLSATVLLFCNTCAHIRLDPVLPHMLPSECGAERADIRAVTFNAAVAPGMNPLATPRLPYVIDALKHLDYDLLCIEEVWPYEDAEAIFKGLGVPADNVAYSDTRGVNETGEDVCSADDMSGLESCVRDKCGGVSDEDTTVCALSQCRPSLVYLHLFHKKCLNCLVASVGKSVAGIHEACTAPGGASRLYGGTTGVMLISKFPVISREAMLLPSSNANKVGLFARVLGPGKQPIEVACTHISSSQAIPPTNPQFDSWDAEESEQFRLIAEHMAERAGNLPQIFLGDMNFGRGRGSAIKESQGDSWDAAMRTGFVSPAANATPPICSVCSDNTFRLGSDNHLIDHVMLRDPPGGAELDPVCVQRLFTEQLVIQAYGKPVKTHLSDHYGIRVDFKLR